MRKRKKLVGVLMIAASLVIMQLPVSEADAASSSASDFRIEGSKLVKYRGTEKNVSVPDTVKTIGQGAFEDDVNVELVVLPNSVEQIESYAFWGCENLDTVVLGKGVTAIGDYAFAGCSGLEQMTIPDNVTSIGIQAFGDCVNLKDISIPPQTTQIHETAFDGCYQLTIHSEEGSAADTYAQAFYERQKEMPEYEDVPGYNQPEGETDQDQMNPSPTASPDQSPAGSGDDSSSGEDAVQTPKPEPVVPTPEPDYSNGNELGSSKVVGNSAVIFMNPVNINVLDGAVPAVPTEGVEPVASDYMDETLTEGLAKYVFVDNRIVADQAFYRSRDLKDVVLPEGIREIGQFSFARSTLETIGIPQGVECICYGAFYHCDDLREVSLPDSVQNLEPKAFAYTAWVQEFLQGAGTDQVTGPSDYLVSGGVLVAYRGAGEEAVIPEGVRVIGAEVFQGHEEMKRVVMPESLKVIGEGAFEDCRALEEIVLNEGLEQIKDRAFYHCNKAAAVSVPASVKELGLQALEGMEVEYAGEMPAQTFEESATRLSNESYRGLLDTDTNGEARTDTENDAEVDATAGAKVSAETEAGVTVTGVEGSFAHLEGAKRAYTLQIAASEAPESMERACLRAFHSDMPESMAVYEMTLSDSSQIPLTKLGHQTLTVVLPLPEKLQGQNVRVFTLDRNGQLEVLLSERVSTNGREAVRFQTNKVSLIGIYGMGAADQGEELLEVSVDMLKMTQGPVVVSRGEQRAFLGNLLKLCGAGALMFAGIAMLLPDRRKKAKRS